MSDAHITRHQNSLRASWETAATQALQARSFPHRYIPRPPTHRPLSREASSLALPASALLTYGGTG
ncbi:hypothetical protein E2C01_055559 [Portunus trituberculatus]|uniref:Uncharacterized protein n=1 Tax=Portunus trituberculatus TaxID=210409 RepID=A0A5B7GW94_PORTR|nr:hypothetical protein [Portunus trituberculatus]